MQVPVQIRTHSPFLPHTEQLFCPVAVSKLGLFREDWQRVKEGNVASVLQWRSGMSSSGRSVRIQPVNFRPFDDFPVPGDEDAVTGWVWRRAANQARDEVGERFPDLGNSCLMP